MNINLKKQTDQLWACLIDDIQHDYKTATMLIRLKDPETEEFHTIKFEHVRTILWTMANVEGEINQNVFPEFTSIVLKNIKLKVKDKWLINYSTRFNICIEIMDRALLINSSLIVVDGCSYEI